MGKILEEPFHLTKNDAGVSAADGVASTWSDIFKYQVPQGVTHILKNEHTISIYFDDGSEIAAPEAQFKIEVRDPGEMEKKSVYGPAMYVRATEFQDRTKMAHLNVPAEGLHVRARDWIVLMVYDNGTVANADSFFDLFINRIRESVV